MIDLPVPTIIRPLDVGAWSHADAQMQRLGLPRNVRRAVQQELKRIVGEKPAIQRATIDDLAKYAGEPKLGTFPFPVMAPKTAPTGIVTYLGNSFQTLGTGTYDWNGPAINIAAGETLVVAPLRESIIGSSITSLTANGTAMTRWSPSVVIMSGSAALWTEFYIAQPSAGTAILLEAITTGTISLSMIAWKLPAGMSMTPKDAVTVAGATSASAVLADIDRVAGGGVMAVAGLSSPVTPTFSESWTGAEAVIEDFQGLTTTGNTKIAACHFDSLSAVSTDDLTFNLSASNLRSAAAISIGP